MGKNEFSARSFCLTLATAMLIGWALVTMLGGCACSKRSQERKYCERINTF